MFKRQHDKERGQALIEFALLFPFLMVLVFVLLDFGIALDRRVVIQHAVREGARQGAVGLPVDIAGDDNDIKDIAVSQSQEVLERDNITVCFEDGPDANTTVGDAGDRVRVNATYVYDFEPGRDINFVPGSLSITMTPSGSARLEKPVTGATEC